MFKNILVPLDGSDLAERVIQGIAPYRTADGTVHLVRVIPAAPGSAPTPFEESQEIEAKSYLEFLSQDAGGSVRTSVRRGTAADEILGAAKEAGADLIALSTHGESGIGRLVFGSVADRVARSAECPLLVFGASAAAAGTKPERMIVALDGTPEAEAGVAPAGRLASARGMSLLLLTVVETLWAAGDSALARTQARDVKKAADRLKALTDELKAKGVKAASLLVRGDPAGELMIQVKRRRADLLCMSTQVRGTVGRWVFGSVTEEILKAVAVPVLVVRKSPPAR